MLSLITRITFCHFVGCLLMLHLTRRACLKCTALYKVPWREILERMQRNILAINENRILLRHTNRFFRERVAKRLYCLGCFFWYLSILCIKCVFFYRQTFCAKYENVVAEVVAVYCESPMEYLSEMYRFIKHSIWCLHLQAVWRWTDWLFSFTMLTADGDTNLLR